MFPPPISRRGWLVVCCVATLLATLFILPYLLGHTLSRPGLVYTGLLINIEDGSYLSAIEQGRQGSWGYRNLFTAESHQPVFIQGFYLALGHLARLFGLSAVAAWHAGLFLANFLFFTTLYGFVAFFFPNLLQRHVAYALIVLGGGFDWLPFPLWFERPNTLEAVPVDLFVPEAHPFFSALTYPHFIAGITLIMLTLWLAFCALAATGNRRWLFALAAGICNLLLGVVYPFLILLIAGVLAAYYLYLLWRSRRLLWTEAFSLALVFLIPVPLFIYYAAALAANPVMQRWNSQAITLSPNPLHYILAYLPYLIPTLLTLRFFKRTNVPRQEAFIFLWIWLAVTVVLLYTPINPQRRFVEGLQLPLAILATIGLFEWVLPWLGRTRLFHLLASRPRYSLAGLQRLVVVTLILFSGLINFFIYATTLYSLAYQQRYPLFRPLAEVEAMVWLHDQLPADDLVLATSWTGSYLPAVSGHPVFVGQRFETVAFVEKQQLADQFYDVATSDDWRRSFLVQNQVAYLFWGRYERKAGAFDPATADYLQPVFENELTSIYRVQLPGP